MKLIAAELTQGEARSLVLVFLASTLGALLSRWQLRIALPTVVLTPHNGGMTREVIAAGLLRAVEDVEHFLGGRPRDVVVPPPR